MGFGLLGLLYLTSKKNKKNTEIENITDEESIVIDANNDKHTVTSAFIMHKYFNKTQLEWKVPDDEVSKYPLHLFAGFDYMKLHPNEPPIFGRYMKLPESVRDLMVKLEPSVTIGNSVTINNEVFTLVMCGHNFPTVSAITIYFAENINNEELSICKMKKIYKDMVRNYTCKKIIDPPIEWYNQSLWDDNTYLYKNLCGEGDTSTLETDQMLDTNVLDDSETSDMEEDSDMTSMDNQTEIDNFIDSITSKDNSDLTSLENEEELEKFIDSITSLDESVSKLDKKSEDKKSEDKKSENINLSDTSDDNDPIDVISATSYDNSEMYTIKKKKCSKKKKCAKKSNAKPKKSNAKPKKSNAKPKKSNAKPKKSNAKPKKSNAKPKKSKKKKSKKKKSQKSENLDLIGGSSSLTNVSKSILGRF